ncbi:hypothetical protein E3T40_15055 [Cryobacterium sp. TMT1-19]|uniref:hypothetical protein n=1 Tax=Cryobacterium sp. TMT1-19 TaxID=1259231 RepID=UPI00106D3492|nr:hypothetical protein [Cryobacterium sp. TMT1-19]TFD30319.1 hypothetical protein E3T40_15055 [Cryobacterium sp. TMT1-19]
MDLNRLWVFGTVILIGAAAVLGWVLGVAPKLDEAQLADADREIVETQNSAYEAQVSTLKKKFDSIVSLRTDLSSLRMAVPSAAEIPDFVAQLDTIAQQHQVTLTSILVSDAQPYVPVVAVAPVEPVAEPAEESQPAPTPAPIAVAAPTAAEVAAALAPQPNELITGTNFVSVPISLSVTGSYGNVLDFLESLQKGTRLVMVTTFATSEGSATTPASGGPIPAAAVGTEATETAVISTDVVASIAGLIYVLLDPAASPTPAE